MTDGWGASDVLADMRAAISKAHETPEFREAVLSAGLYDVALAQGLPMGGYRRLSPEPLPMTEKAWTYSYPPPRPSVKLDKWSNRQRAKAKATAKRVAASKAARKARKR